MALRPAGRTPIFPTNAALGVSLKIVSLTGATMLLALAALPAVADCAKPGKAPAMPQGATATQEDMKAGHDALQAYVNTLQTYKDCLAALIANAPADTKPELKQQWRDEGNAAIDAADAIAAVYSSQLNAFRAQGR